MRDMGSFVVTTIVDPLTFVLSNKSVVHLAGVDLPVYPGEKENAFAALALQRMKALYLGQKVTFFQTRAQDKGRINAMGQSLGHIVKRENGKEIWAQQVLVREGLVRVLPTSSNKEGADLLYKAEETPRQKRTGIWGSQPWSVKNPESVAAYTGTVQVVEGIVQNVATRNNVTYLNFGRDYKTDFTIVIDGTARRALMKDGLNPLGLSGKTVQVRGFVEDYNGPAIELDNARLLRVIVSQSSSPASGAREGDLGQQ